MERECIAANALNCPRWKDSSNETETSAPQVLVLTFKDGVNRVFCNNFAVQGEYRCSDGDGDCTYKKGK